MHFEGDGGITASQVDPTNGSRALSENNPSWLPRPPAVRQDVGSPFPPCSARVAMTHETLLGDIRWKLLP